MMETKESFWKRKGFYWAACVLVIGIMAVAAVFYRGGNTGDDNQGMMANIATEIPGNTAKVAGDGALDVNQDAAQANANPIQELAEAQAKAKKAAKKQNTSEKKNSQSKGTAKPTAKPKSTGTTTEKNGTKKNSTSNSTTTTATTSQKIQHTFDAEKGLLWPVQGDVIMKYSMTNTIYFKTLAQYKCNPGIMISAEKGTEVKAAADCCVTKIRNDAEYGTIVTTDIGSNYLVSYGQLDNISVNKGDELKEGDVLGTVAHPTKYFTEEGSNLYLQVVQNSEAVDPMLLLR